MKLFPAILWILVSLLVSTTTLVAQSNDSEPTDFGTTGETDCNPADSPDVPIDNNIILLFIAGIGYAIRVFHFNFIHKIK
jgi:hypothetical protein